MIPSGQSSNSATWVRCQWTASMSPALEYYLVELIPLIPDPVNGEPVPRPELKTTAKTERDLSSGTIPAEYIFHNLPAGIAYRIQVAAVDRYGNISNVLSEDIFSGGSIPELNSSDITLNPLQVHLHGVLVSWDVLPSVETRINHFEVFSDTESFSDLTGDRLSYSGTATQIIVPSNTVTYIKFRAIDILGRPSPILSASIDAGTSALAPPNIVV
ncbi:MAG: hypothetical protein H8E26_13175 [FCB group bacterium]|nr:hypothetical protein [FCB group bacterium]